ncbi:MAG: hypothetical protein A2849_02070 [Candidatus Taylorbacteria bacterium RIFCSPHIGHO2_01_FULL_51_15]|uniref:Uncharacterized protein n=1 Tax=Candidatus Taylorbacteria bacterium RIFCSPHIGHO2_01_FULL_51_15 TaxID=1802304 RepID=A0A1G2MAX5_9BACT|nr:MAG: hypothetical protein A2849_02070 [Candidatus Taylorbacteria bacterium RIFCSPHIGHO2_01_FULL_51_15]
MYNQQTALEAARERFQNIRYTPEEIARIVAFLEKFCDVAVVYLTELFVRAKVYKAPRCLDTVLLIGEFYYQFAWKFGTPDRIGDPDDVAVDESAPTHSAEVTDWYLGGESRVRVVTGIKSTIGWRNATALTSAYGALGVPMLKGIH